MHCIQEIIPLPELCSVLQSCSTSLLGACVKPAYPNHSLDDALHKHPFTLNCPLATEGHVQPYKGQIFGIASMKITVEGDFNSMLHKLFTNVGTSGS